MEKKIKIIRGLIITLMLSTYITCGMQAQDYEFGLKTGFSAVTQTGNFIFTDGNISVDLSSGFMAGYTIGILSRLTVDDNLRLIAEFNYSRYGAAYDGSFEFQNQTIFTQSQTGIRYLQVPVLIEWHTGPPDLGPFRYPRPHWTWHLRGGGYSAYRIDAVFSGSNSAEILGVDFSSDFKNNVTDSFRAFDAGLMLGGAVEYGLRRKLGFETRFVMGLLDVGTNMNTRNIGFNFGMYYIL